MKLIRLLIFTSVFISHTAHALLEVNVIKKREAAFPIVIAPFEIVDKSFVVAEVELTVTVVEAIISTSEESEGSEPEAQVDPVAQVPV